MLEKAKILKSWNFLVRYRRTYVVSKKFLLLMVCKYVINLLTIMCKVSKVVLNYFIPFSFTTFLGFFYKKNIKIV